MGYIRAHDFTVNIGLHTPYAGVSHQASSRLSGTFAALFYTPLPVLGGCFFDNQSFKTKGHITVKQDYAYKRFSRFLGSNICRVIEIGWQLSVSK